MAARTLVTLSPSEGTALLLALPLVLGTRLALWLLPSDAIVRGVRRLSRGRELSSAIFQQWVTPVWAVSAVARRVPHASCLTQAIAALLLLRIYGFSARFCLGVGFDGSAGFRAHAWLESLEGRILIGEAGTYALRRLQI